MKLTIMWRHNFSLEIDIKYRVLNKCLSNKNDIHVCITI